ncbi:hypothetical protein MASR1M59_29400 [Melaminivora sp.]
MAWAGRLIRHKASGAVDTLCGIEYLKFGSTVYEAPNASADLPSAGQFAEIAGYLHMPTVDLTLIGWPAPSMMG